MSQELIRRRHDVHVEGDGPITYVLVHGLASDQRVWDAVTARLVDDARVVRFDLAGCGRSDPTAGDTARLERLEGYAADVADVVAAFGGARTVLVGHSVGGALGLLASRMIPHRIARAVLLAPSPRYLDDPPGYRGGFCPEDITALLELMERNFVGWSASFSSTVTATPEVAAVVRDGFRTVDPKRLRAFAALAFALDLRGALGGFELPTLVVQCAHDAIVPVAAGEAMARMLPRGAYQLIDVGGHFPHVSHPALVAGIIRAFAEAP